MQLINSIRVSSDVYDAIATRGKFGETPDDVLRRVFRIRPNPTVSRGRNLTSLKQRAVVNRSENGKSLLIIEYENGKSKTLELPADRQNRVMTRSVLGDAFCFAESNNATQGQLNAIRKAISGAGYYLIK